MLCLLTHRILELGRSQFGNHCFISTKSRTRERNLQKVTPYEAMGLSLCATSPHIQSNPTFIEHLLHARLSARHLARYWEHMPGFLKSVPSP